MRGQKGFTITELLVAVVISSVVMTSIYAAYMSQQKAYTVTEDVSAVQQNIRAAMYYMEREIRMAGYDPQGTANGGFFNVSQNPATAIEFSWDGAASGTTSNGTDEAAEHIYYRVNSDKIQRQIGSGGYQNVAENISGVSFYFLDASGNPTTVLANIRSVQITLAATHGGHNRELEARVLCRNMGL